jgi:hypothetical protein
MLNGIAREMLQFTATAAVQQNGSIAAKKTQRRFRYCNMCGCWQKLRSLSSKRALEGAVSGRGPQPFRFSIAASTDLFMLSPFAADATGPDFQCAAILGPRRTRDPNDRVFQGLPVALRLVSQP